MSVDINDAVIEAAARCIYESDHFPLSWDEQSDDLRESYRRKARALAEDGLLTSELPTERLPVGQVRRSPDGKIVAVRFSRAVNPWSCTGGRCRDDDDVRDWPIFVPEADLDDLRAERDRLAAADGGAIDADELAQALIDSGRIPFDGEFEEVTARDCANVIREHLPAATRTATPEGHVAVDMSGVEENLLGVWSTTTGRDDWLSRVSQAELARRAAEGVDA